jgi:alpha-glucosidase
MPELNWRNPEVEDAMFDVVRLWMGRGADGIRIDCAHYLMKDPEMRDNPVNPKGDVLGHRPLGEYDSEIHLYDKGHEDIHPILRRLRTLLGGYEPPRVAIGEIHIYDWSLWAAYYGAELDELHMVFNFGLLGVKWEAAEVRALVEATYSALPPDGWPNWVIGNHDEPRIATMHGRDRARLALLLVLTLRGTPTLYYGDELGMGDTSLSAAGTLDPFGLQDPSLSRDPQRAPMPWTRQPNAGFTEPGVEPWVPLVDDASDINVQAQQEDPASMFRFTQSLLLLRKERREMQSGSYLPLDTPEGVYGFVRELDGRRSAICINFSEEPVSFEAPSQAGRILMNVRGDTSLGEGMLFLGPLDGAVIDLPD